MAEDLTQSGIEDHNFGPTNVREHFPKEELTPGKTRLLVLQPLRWCCIDCVIHHERDVREEQKHMYVARTSNNRVIPME